MSFETFHQAATANLSSFPSVETLGNNDLHLEVTRLTAGTASGVANESDSAKVGRWFQEMQAAGSSDFVEEISSQFATALNAANGNLKQVSDIVDKLAASYESMCQLRMAHNPVLATDKNTKIAPVVYGEYPYEKLAVCGNKHQLYGYVAEACNIVDFKLGNVQQLSSIKERFPAREMNATKLENVTISAETIKALGEKILASDKNLTAQTVDAVLGMITSKERLAAASATVVRHVSSLNVDVAGIELLTLAESIRTVTSKLDKVLSSVELNSDQVSKLSKNVSFAEACADFSGFYVSWHRDSTFKDTILMRCGKTNPDKRAEATAAGLTDSALAKHVAIVNHGSVQANEGVRLAAVIENQAKVAAISSKEDLDKQARSRAALMQIRGESFNFVMGEYFRTAPTTVKASGLANLTDYISLKATAVASKGIAAEDMMYDILLNSCYRGGLECLLHERLGQGYTKLASSGGTIDDNQVALAAVGVYAEVITEFIAKKFLK